MTTSVRNTTPLFGGHAVFLLLTDARMPTGGHAHSGGLEEAVGSGRVRSMTDLRGFLEGRLATNGLAQAALAAAAVLTAVAHREDSDALRASFALLDAEAAARCPSPVLRRTARAQGGRLLRLGRRAWPDAALGELATATDGRPIWAVAFGVLGAATGLDAEQVAAAVAGASVTEPAWASVRLLSLDPFEVAATLVALAPTIDEVAAAAARAARDQPPAGLPADGAPLLDLGAERHAGREVRLFAS